MTRLGRSLSALIPCLLQAFDFNTENKALKTQSLPLDRRRRFPRYVVDHSGNSRHFIDHAVRDPIQELIR